MSNYSFIRPQAWKTATHLLQLCGERWHHFGRTRQKDSWHCIQELQVHREMPVAHGEGWFRWAICHNSSTDWHEIAEEDSCPRQMSPSQTLYLTGLPQPFFSLQSIKAFTTCSASQAPVSTRQKLTHAQPHMGLQNHLRHHFRVAASLRGREHRNRSCSQVVVVLAPKLG